MLTKQVFEVGAKKEHRINPDHPHFQKVASYQTMESYRNIWNNFFNYLHEHWHIKDAEKISSEHIAAYMDYKIEYYPSKQYLEKLSAALGKLEVALKLFAKNVYHEDMEYDFSVRQYILDEARNLDLIADNYHHRAYENPMDLIYGLTDPLHRLAASIEYEGGARLEGCSLIKREQLSGYRRDPITGVVVGIIRTREKGGKEGDVKILTPTYEWLKEHILEYGRFKINRQKYASDIRKTCELLEIKANGSHGLRWNFAKRRMFEYAQAGYSYSESLKNVSNEMKHNRSSITEHYLGG